MTMSWTLNGLNNLSEKLLKLMVLNVVALLELIMTLGVFGIGPVTVGMFAVMGHKEELTFLEAVGYQVKSFKKHFFAINKNCLYHILVSLVMLYTLLVIHWSRATVLDRYRPLLIGLLLLNLLMIIINSFFYQQYGLKGAAQQNAVFLLMFSPLGVLKAILLLFAFSYIGYLWPILVAFCLVSLYLKLMFQQLRQTMKKVNALNEK